MRRATAGGGAAEPRRATRRRHVWSGLTLAFVLAAGACAPARTPVPGPSTSAADPISEARTAPPPARRSPAEATRPATEHRVAPSPHRIVSLDYCADQYVLGLAERSAILRVSPDATSGFSYLRARARGLPTVRPRAEDVLLLQPDLVVRSYGGGPRARALFERAGVPVLQLGYAGDLNAVRRTLLTAAEQLGQGARGRALVQDMNRRLNAVARQARTRDGRQPRVLYVTAGGVTAGPGTLIDELIEAAGLANFERRPGWHPVPLERLAYEDPDLLALAFFGSPAHRVNRWSASRHPLARDRIRDLPTLNLAAAAVSCGGWFLVDAVEALAEAAAPASALATRR